MGEPITRLARVIALEGSKTKTKATVGVSGEASHFVLTLHVLQHIVCFLQLLLGCFCRAYCCSSGSFSSRPFHSHKPLELGSHCAILVLGKQSTFPVVVRCAWHFLWLLILLPEHSSSLQLLLDAIHARCSSKKSSLLLCIGLHLLGQLLCQTQTGQVLLRGQRWR